MTRAETLDKDNVNSDGKSISAATAITRWVYAVHAVCGGFENHNAQRGADITTKNNKENNDDKC